MCSSDLADAITLSDEDRASIAAHLERMSKLAELYCTGCEYCLPCPQEVAIPRIFQRYNEGRVYGLWDQAKAAYNEGWRDRNGARADACVQCGECEEKCPQHIAIREQLAEAHEALNTP